MFEQGSTLHDFKRLSKYMCVIILYIAMEMWDSRVDSLSQICRAELANSFPSNLLNFKKPVSQHGNGKVNLV